MQNIMSILHEFKTKEGRTVTVNRFQAKRIADIAQEAIKSGHASPTAMAFYMACQITHIEGQPVTMEQFRALPINAGMQIVEKLGATISSVTIDKDGTLHGNLPSGKDIAIRATTIGDMIDAGTRHGEENRVFSMIEMTCKIQDTPMDFVDAQLMDGLDFLAIQAYLNADPS